MFHNFLIHLSVDGHLGCFHVLAMVCVKSLQSYPTLCDPRDRSPPGSSLRGILQARILEWVTIPSSRGPSWPRDRTWVSQILYFVSHQWRPQAHSSDRKFAAQRGIWISVLQVDLITKYLQSWFAVSEVVDPCLYPGQGQALRGKWGRIPYHGEGCINSFKQ